MNQLFTEVLQNADWGDESIGLGLEFRHSEDSEHGSRVLKRLEAITTSY